MSCPPAGIRSKDLQAIARGKRQIPKIFEVCSYCSRQEPKFRYFYEAKKDCVCPKLTIRSISNSCIAKTNAEGKNLLKLNGIWMHNLKASRKPLHSENCEFAFWFYWIFAAMKIKIKTKKSVRFACSFPFIFSKCNFRSGAAIALFVNHNSTDSSDGNRILAHFLPCSFFLLHLIHDYVFTSTATACYYYYYYIFHSSIHSGCSSLPCTFVQRIRVEQSKCSSVCTQSDKEMQ